MGGGSLKGKDIDTCRHFHNMKTLSIGDVHRIREGLTQKTKKKCEISPLGGGLDKIGSFSHFFYFFSFMS